jgi:hypothetical protein
MPQNTLIDWLQFKELLAVAVAMAAGLIARTLVSEEPFKTQTFIGELILACMFGAAIYAFGIIQDMGFWQTMLIALLSGMGTTRSIEWVIKASKIGKGE